METSNKSNHFSSSSTNLPAKMQRYPLFFFFLIAYLSSWIVSIPFILSEWGLLNGNFTPVFALKSFGPFLAAYILIRFTEGKEGILRLRQRMRQTKAVWKWYLFILIGIPFILILGILIQPGALTNFQGLHPSLLLRYPLTYIAVLIAGGPLGEEPGWRGFALPRMQLRYGPLGGTLLLGVLWTGWHLPDFLTSAQGGGPDTGFSTFLTNFPIFFLLIMALAIIFTWIFNHTKGSIFIALLAHASVNTPQAVLVPLFPTLNTTSLNLAAMIGFGIPALLILLFTRGKLGYHIYQSQEVG